MRIKLTIAFAGTALAMLALSGCTASSGGSEAPPSSDSSATSGAAVTTDVATADSSFGTIVVDGKGLTAYYFDKDTANSGTSACTGDCLTAWPPIVSATETPNVSRITGTVGTIKDAAGDNQITINGMPIYTYAQDKAAGDVVGQGVGGVWWVIAPDGTKISTPAG